MSVRGAVAAALATAALAAAPALAASGDLDPGFGSGGIFTGPLQTSQNDRNQLITVDAEGRTLLAFTYRTGNDGKLAVARLTNAGALDTTFNPGGSTPGIVVVDFTDRPGKYVAAAGIAAGPGGTTIAAAGLVNIVGAGTDHELGLVRLTSTGAYDNDFSGDGRLVTTATGLATSPWDVDVDTGGRVLAAGLAQSPSCPMAPCVRRGFVSRFTPLGAPDSDWDGDGHALIGTTSESVQLYAVTALPGDGAVVGGYVDNLALAARLTSTGTLDSGFDGDGRATMDFGAPLTGGSSGVAFDVAVDGLGRVYLGGQATTSIATAAVGRFTPQGAPDPSFGTGIADTGVVYLPHPDMVRVSGLAIQCGDRVLAGGHGIYDPDGSGPLADRNAIAFGRLTGAGALDAGFAASQPRPGMIQLPLGNFPGSGGSRVAVAPGDLPLLAGFREESAAYKPLVARFQETPGCGAAPPPPAPPPPASAPAPGPGTEPITGPVPAPKFAEIVRLPSTKRCASRRLFRIRLRIPRGLTVSSAVVSVNGKRVRVVRGRRLTAPVDLRDLPKGRFSVKIVVTLADGRSVQGTRRYRTCAPKRRSGRRPQV